MTTTNDGYVLDARQGKELMGYINMLNTRIIYDSGEGYIRYSDGTMICYGSGTTSDSNNVRITFQQEFTTVPIVSATPSYINRDWVMILSVYVWSLTGFDVVEFVKNREDSSGSFIFGTDTFNWIAIGKWKN